MKAVRGSLGALVCLAWTTQVWADAQTTILMDLLRVNEVADIMRAEGLGYASELDRDMMNGQGGVFWTEQLGQIYALPRMTETVRQALEAGLTKTEKSAAIAFFRTEPGQRFIEYETTSRKAMQDEAVEEVAKNRCAEPGDDDLAHLAEIDRFVSQNDLVERNVTGALSSNYRFYLGLADGGFSDQSEAEILSEVYAQEPDIRDETDSWLCGFLLLAYRPLPLEDVESYVDFYASPAGRALNAALFEGYEAMYRDISYALGRAVALSAAGDDI